MSRREEGREPEVVRLRPRGFEAFYRQEADSVYRALAVALGDIDLAQEAAAEALARAYQNWSKIEDYQNPGGWAYRVGFNWAMSRLRRRRRDRAHREDRRPGDAPEALATDMDRALRTLDPNKRTVIVMRYVLDLSQEDIAAALSLPIGTVKSRLGRGLEELREMLR